MKVTTIVSKIDVLGKSWYGQTAATTYNLTSHDIENIRDSGTITREAVENWLTSHSGDFQNIIDFTATIGDDEFDCDWQNEASEYTFTDCMYGDCEDWEVVEG